MKKILVPLVLASVGLGGCVAVPYGGYAAPYDGGYAPAPVYVAPPAVVIRPTYYGYYGGGRNYRYHNRY